MKAFSSGAAVYQFDTLDSTMLEAKRRVAAGARGPCWIIALRQTAAYGRRQRAWEQHPGDLAATLLVEREGPLDRSGQLSFVTALAVANALDGYASPEKISLKWPNDVLIDRKKCVGILLENLGEALAIGIGANIVSAPDDLPYPAARLMDVTDKPPAPQDLARSIDRCFFDLFHQWRENGFAPIRERWLARAAGVGDEIIVRLPNEEFSGVFEGLDDEGGLIVGSPAGRRTVAAGEVFFRRGGSGTARN